MSEGMRRVQGRASSWIPKFCRAPKSKQQLELHSVTEQHHPHSRHSVGSPTWSSRRCHRSPFVPDTGSPHCLHAALRSCHSRRRSDGTAGALSYACQVTPCSNRAGTTAPMLLSSANAQ